METRIPMVDLHGQYLNIKSDIDRAIQQVIDSCSFIGGPAVASFRDHLLSGKYADVRECHIEPYGCWCMNC